MHNKRCLIAVLVSLLMTPVACTYAQTINEDSTSQQAPAVEDPSMITLTGFDKDARRVTVGLESYRLTLSARILSPEDEVLAGDEVLSYIGYGVKVKRNKSGDVTDLYILQAN